MAFFIDTVQSLAVRARNAFRSELPGTDAWIWPNNIAVTAKVFAGLIWGLFGALQRVDRNRFIMTADSDSVKRYGAEYKMTQGPPTFAQGAIDVPCTSPFTVPSGTVFTYRYGQTNLSFTTTIAVSTPAYPVPTATKITVPVVANHSGAKSNLVAGTPVVSGLGGAGSCVVNEVGIAGGTDGESLDDFRLRVLHRRQRVPAGGNEDDYVSWMRSISGVTRAWAAGNLYGPGTVGCFFLMDDTYPFGLPTANDVATVQAYLDSVAPVTAKVLVRAPTAVPVNVVISKLTPDTPDVRNAAAAELISVFRRMIGVSVPSAPTTLYQSWLWRAVSNATGERHHTLTAPASDLVFPTGQIPILQSVTFSN